MNPKTHSHILIPITYISSLSSRIRTNSPFLSHSTPCYDSNMKFRFAAFSRSDDGIIPPNHIIALTRFTYAVFDFDIYSNHHIYRLIIRIQNIGRYINSSFATHIFMPKYQVSSRCKHHIAHISIELHSSAFTQPTKRPLYQIM